MTEALNHDRPKENATMTEGLGRNETTVEVYTYTVEGRMDGLYVFADPWDRDAFAAAVVESGGSGYASSEPVIHRGTTLDDLIEQELAE